MSRFFAVILVVSLPCVAFADAEDAGTDAPVDAITAEDTGDATTASEDAADTSDATTASEDAADIADASLDSAAGEDTSVDAAASDDANTATVLPGASEVVVEVHAVHRGSVAPPAMVTLEGEGARREVVIDGEDARFEAVDHGAYLVRVDAPGFAPAAREVVVAGPRSVAISIYPASSVTLRGRVEASSGGAVAGASVNAVGLGDHLFGIVPYGETDADGDFSLEAIPAGYYRVSIDAAGYRALVLSRVDALGDSEINVRLVDTSEVPAVEETRGCATAGRGWRGSPAWSLALVAVAARRRRRRG